MYKQQESMALLVMDMQTAILNSFSGAAELIPRVSSAIAMARERKIPVMYVTVGFRPGAPEISPENKGFSSNAAMFTSIKPEEFQLVHPDLAPLKKDILVTKRRISAFAGSDLEIVLRAQHIRHLVLTGIATSGVVLSTLREAADKDFHLTVLSDACADRDEEVHRVLMHKVFPRQAEVRTVEDWGNN
jgi:nicotinamidase-related amidase